MPPVEITPGLFRWTAAHPDWDPEAAPGGPDDWGQYVGSVLYEAPDAVVLIDPLIPREDRAELLSWLDARVAGRPVSVLTTIRWHRRDREELAERYEANSSRAWNVVPHGVERDRCAEPARRCSGCRPSRRRRARAPPASRGVMRARVRRGLLPTRRRRFERGISTSFLAWL